MDYMRLQPSSREVIAIAQSLAVRRGHAEVGPEHLLLALLRPQAGTADFPLARLGSPPAELSASLESFLERARPEYSRKTRLASGLEAGLEAAERQADVRGSGAITPRHMLAALLQSASEAGELLRERGVTASGIFDELSPLHRDPKSRNSTPGSPRDLIAEAARGKLDPVLGRDEATTQLMDILVGRRHHPVVLGEKGVGRTAIVEALARILVRSDAPKAVRGSKLFVGDSSLLEDGFDDSNPIWSSGSSRVLLYVQDPLVLAQTARALRAAEPPMDVTLIGRATPDEYYGSLSRQPYLEGIFETVLVEPLSVPTTLIVLRSLRSRFEARHGVGIQDGALEAAADLSSRFLSEIKLPGAALDLLDKSAESRRQKVESPPEELERAEAQVFKLTSRRERSAEADDELSELRTAAGWLRARWEQEQEARDRVRALRAQLQGRDDGMLSRRLQEAEKSLPDSGAGLIEADVTSEDVSLMVEQQSDARLGGLLLDARTRLVRLEKKLGDDVLGQRRATCAIASALMKGSVKLEAASGLGASLLFSGPPGVGKTEAARSLARHFLNDESALVQVHGDDAPGVLEALSRTPCAVVLVQEISRASSEVVRLLTRVLDEGTAPDPAGCRVDLRRTLLVLCSRESSVSWLSRRVDAVVEFGPLDRDIVRILADRKCRELSDRLRERRVVLDWSSGAIEWLAERGFDREEGAHRLQRILADEVGSRLGRMLVLGELSDGSHACVEVQGDRLDVATLRTDSGPKPATLYV